MALLASPVPVTRLAGWAGCSPHLNSPPHDLQSSGFRWDFECRRNHVKPCLSSPAWPSSLLALVTCRELSPIIDASGLRPHPVSQDAGWNINEKWPPLCPSVVSTSAPSQGARHCGPCRRHPQAHQGCAVITEHVLEAGMLTVLEHRRAASTSVMLTWIAHIGNPGTRGEASTMGTVSGLPHPRWVSVSPPATATGECVLSPGLCPAYQSPGAQGHSAFTLL